MLMDDFKCYPNGLNRLGVKQKKSLIPFLCVSEPPLVLRSSPRPASSLSKSDSEQQAVLRRGALHHPLSPVPDELLGLGAHALFCKSKSDKESAE